MTFPNPRIDALKANDFVFGAKSLRNQHTAHPILAMNFSIALFFTPVDFSIYETDRTLERQKQLLADKRTQTLDSMHIPGEDGFARAGDLVPWVDGENVWQLGLCYEICKAMVVATTLTKTQVKFGGCWEILTPDFNPRARVEAYIARRKAQKKKPFVDAVHYELA